MKPAPRLAPALAALVALLALRCGGAPLSPPAAIGPARDAAPEAAEPAAEREASGPRRAPTRAEFAFAFDAGDEVGLVLAEDLEPFMLQGEPELVTALDADPLLVRQVIAERSLPDEVLALRGQAVTLYDGERRLCEGGVVGFAAVSRLHRPGISWAGEPQGGSPGTRQEIATEAWSMGFQSLIALVRTPSRCAGATWGRLSALPPPRFAFSEPAGGVLGERAVEAFRALPAYAEAQRSFDEEQANRRVNGLETEEGPWDGEGGAQVVQLPWSGRTLVWRTARTGEICGFRASLGATWEVRGGTGGPAGASLGLLESGAEGLDLQLLLDANGDGHLEGVFGDPDGDATQLVSWPDDDEKTLRTISLPSTGCPC